MDKVDTIKFLAKRCYHGKNVINPYTGQQKADGVFYRGSA